MTLQEELKIKAKSNFDDLWDEIKHDLEKAAENWQSLTYTNSIPEYRFFNFVIANREKYEKEGITVTHAEGPFETVTLSWV